MNHHRRTRLLYAVHKWTGLLIGFNVFLFSITAVFLLAVDLALPGEEVSRTPLDTARLLPVQPMLDKLAAHYADHGFRADSVAFATAEGERHEIRIDVGGERHAHLRYRADPYTGALQLSRGTVPADIPPYAEQAPADAEGASAAVPGEVPLPLYARIDAFMFELHSSLALGIPGLFITGVLGVVFLISTITGWIIYGPFMKALVFGMIRQGKAAHMRAADMHKLVGIGALAFNLVMAVTGIGLTLGLFAIQMQVRQDLMTIESLAGEIVPVDPPPSADAARAAAQTVFPEHTITVIDFPGPETIQGEKVFTFFAVRDPADPGLLPEIGIISAEATPVAREYPLHWWMEAILIGAPMHTGSYGGKPMLAAYLLFSLASGFLSLSGYFMYIAKWRRHRRLKRARAAATPAAGAPEPATATPRTVPAPARLGPWGISGLTLAAMAIGILGAGFWDALAMLLLFVPGIAVTRRLFA
ncbi:MAG: PepSY domain-containing protein [Candidatus Hydrogenedentes bacterium]|nr:PepSY domain-containing protein [Candidatus Hydrogenedentota bacterium]